MICIYIYIQICTKNSKKELIQHWIPWFWSNPQHCHYCSSFVVQESRNMHDVRKNVSQRFFAVQEGKLSKLLPFFTIISEYEMWLETSTLEKHCSEIKESCIGELCLPNPQNLHVFYIMEHEYLLPLQYFIPAHEM